MPKIVDHAHYRKELLAKCFTPFATYGYGQISMKQLAEAAGVTTGTLYHYFTDKQALFEALVAEMAQRDLQRSRELLGQPATRAERLDAALELLTEQGDYFLQQLLLLIDYRQHQRNQEPQALAALKTANDALRDSIRQIIPDADSRLLTLICALIDGLLIEQFLNQPNATFTEQAALLRELLTPTTH